MAQAPSREWWPADWADEIMPPGRGDPNDFLIDAQGHYWLGYPLDAANVSEQEKRYFNRALEQNDIVNFVCRDGYPDIRITISADGSYVVRGEVPKDATHFMLAGNPDTLADSLAEFAANEFNSEKEAGSQFPVILPVSVSRWSDAIPHKLTITYQPDMSAQAAFVAVAKAEACQ